MRSQKDYIRLGRHKARTDLIWLAQNILGMKKITAHVHGPMTEFLQKFNKCQGTDVWDDAQHRFIYTPKDPDPFKAIGPDADKRRLLLAPRGWYKTSLNVVAHTVQLILNFPDATCLWLHASQEVLEPVLLLVKQAFWKNNVMRYYFPEFCRPATSKEFGTQTAFNIPCRQIWTASPTLGIGGIESTRTGMHYHWIKFTDIVDEKNTATKEQCEKIIYNFGMCRNLLVSPLYWMDVEGTRYHFSDLYGRIIDTWLEKQKQDQKCEWKIFVMGCYKKFVPKAKEEFTPDELDAPYLLENDSKVSRFPEEFPVDALEAMRTDPVTGPDVFNTQQLNHPVGDDNTPFPWESIQWKSADDMKRVPFMFRKVTIDLSEAKNKKSDFFVATVCGVDRMNRHYVEDIRMGRFLPDEIVDIIFLLQVKYKPLKIKIEESGFLSGLLPTIRRKSEQTGIWPNFEFVRRPTTIKKAERILSFQPWYKGGLFFFSEGLSDFVKEQLRHEFTRFPKYHDDILDTLADMISDEQVYGTIKESKTELETFQLAEKLLQEKAYLFSKVHPDASNTYGAWSGLGAL